MTTTISQFTDVVNAGASVSEPIGGTASPGDWLQVTISSVGGAAGAATPSDNISGATGWVKVAEQDKLAEPQPYYRQDWIKRCVGGETDVTATWAGSVTQGVITGFWASTLTQPDLYVIDQGSFVGVGGSTCGFTSGPGLVLSDFETYVGCMTCGESIFSAAFTNICNTAGGGQNGTVTVIAHYCTDEASHSTADQPTYHFAECRGGAYFVLYGFATTGDDALLFGAGTFGLEGEGELEVTPGDADIDGAGTFGLGGEGELEITGGDQNLHGAGTFGLGGAGRLSAPFPHPVPGPPDRTDLLGCGIYDAMVFTRGLGEIVGRLPFGELDWQRVLDGVSVGNLTVDGVANRSQLQKCCALLGEVEPFEHELAIYRSGYRVWSGPITAMSFPPNQIQISAFDLSGWLQLRTLHENHNAVAPNPGSDLIDIWISYVEDAMSVDNSAGLHPTALALSGILADRLATIVEHNVALDAIGELSRTGIDWTTVDRVMQAGPVLTQPPPILDALEFPLLIDSSFRVPPTILLDGLQGANCWYVQGGGPGPAGAVIFGEYGPEFDATPDHVAQPAAPDYAAIEGQYGRIEKVVSESRALDQPSIDANAKSRYDLTKRPVAVISEGLLLPSAPIAMRKLVPGSLVQVHLANACKPIGDFYRIKSVKVQAHGDGSEDVNVEFQPLGTGTVLGTGDG